MAGVYFCVFSPAGDNEDNPEIIKIKRGLKNG